MCGYSTRPGFFRVGSNESRRLSLRGVSDGGHLRKHLAVVMANADTGDGRRSPPVGRGNSSLGLTMSGRAVLDSVGY